MLQSWKKRFGFTLLELLVTLAILGILVALAVPAVSDWTQRAQVRTETQRVLGALTLARSTAISTSNVVTVDGVPNAAGGLDLSVYIDENGVGNTAFNAGAGDEAIRQIVGEVTSIDMQSSAGRFVSFDAQGRLMSLNGNPTTISIRQDDAQLGRTIDISLVGRPSVTEIDY